MESIIPRFNSNYGAVWPRWLFAKYGFWANMTISPPRDSHCLTPLSESRHSYTIAQRLTSLAVVRVKRQGLTQAEEPQKRNEKN